MADGEKREGRKPAARGRPGPGTAVRAEVRGSADPAEPQPGGHILVAVSASPNSEYLIRWTKRMAIHLNARWTALHVDTGAPLPREDGEALQRYLELAGKLGAEVISVPSTDIAGAIVRYAGIKNAGQIIIGKSSFRSAGRFPRNRFYRKETLTERIVKASGAIDVLVVQEKDFSSPRRSILAGWLRGSPAAGLLVTLAVIACVTALNLLVLPVIGHRSVSIIYLLTITGLVFFLGRGSAVLAPALSALLWNFLFIPPRLTFSIGALEDVLMFVMFFVAAFTTGFLASRLKAEERALAAREERMTLLYSFLQSLSEEKTIPGIVDTSLAAISRYFDAEAVLLLRDEEGGLSGRPLPDEELAAARWCFEHNTPSGKYTATPVGAAYHFVPLAGPDSVVGVLGLRPASGRNWTQDQEDFLRTLGRNLSLSLERELLARQHQRSLMSAESERLSRILLNTISHELRTPLTTIKGSITALLDEATIGDPAARGELLAETHKASDKLNRIVENLLSMSRLESGMLRLSRTWTGVEELIGVVLESMREELAGHPVEVARRDDLPEVSIDLALFRQVLVNILQNAADYTPEGTRIRIAAEVRPGGLAIEIRDDGPGIDAGELPRLFDKFFRGEGNARSGCGLGLAICRGIVEAHGGRIWAASERGEGLGVTLFLPDGMLQRASP